MIQIIETSEQPVIVGSQENSYQKILFQDFNVIWRYCELVRRAWIRKGFEYDLGSVPRALHLIVDDDDNRFLPGWTLHDFLHEFSGIPGLERKEADLVAYEMHLKFNAPHSLANVVYGAVRGFAWTKWNSNPKDLMQFQEGIYKSVKPHGSVLWLNYESNSRA